MVGATLSTMYVVVIDPTFPAPSVPEKVMVLVPLGSSAATAREKTKMPAEAQPAVPLVLTNVIGAVTGRLVEVETYPTAALTLLRLQSVTLTCAPTVEPTLKNWNGVTGGTAAPTSVLASAGAVRSMVKTLVVLLGKSLSATSLASMATEAAPSASEPWTTYW